MREKGELHAYGANYKLKLMHEVLVEDAFENHPMSDGFALSRYGSKTKLFPMMPLPCHDLIY